MKSLAYRLNWCCRRLSVVSATATALTFCPCALATLDEDVTSVAADKVRLQADLRIACKTNYAVHELALPTGGKVREFVTNSGKVFAVSWSGGWRPDLREIMGKHYERYLASTRGKPTARGPVRIELPGLVMVMGGHPRAFFGYVYLLDLLPPDLRIQDIH